MDKYHIIFQKINHFRGNKINAVHTHGYIYIFILLTSITNAICTVQLFDIWELYVIQFKNDLFIDTIKKCIIRFK